SESRSERASACCSLALLPAVIFGPTLGFGAGDWAHVRLARKIRLTTTIQQRLMNTSRPVVSQRGQPLLELSLFVGLGSRVKPRSLDDAVLEKDLYRYLINLQATAQH